MRENSRRRRRRQVPLPFLTPHFRLRRLTLDFLSSRRACTGHQREPTSGVSFAGEPSRQSGGGVPPGSTHCATPAASSTPKRGSRQACLWGRPLARQPRRRIHLLPMTRSRVFRRPSKLPHNSLLTSRRTSCHERHFPSRTRPSSPLASAPDGNHPLEKFCADFSLFLFFIRGCLFAL